MFKPALKWVVRLLPVAAAMVASVAIGASTPAPEASGATSSQSAARHRPPLVAMQSALRVEATYVAADSVDVPPLARAENLELLAANYPVGSLDTALTAPAVKVVSRMDARPAFELPRPDRWTSLLATLALGAFFFLRRIV